MFWLFCWLVAGALFFLILRNAGPAEVREAFHGLRPGWIGLAVLANLLILPAWTGAWLVMLPRDTRVGLWRMGEIVAMTAMAQTTLPLFLGHAGSAVALSRHGRVGSTAVASVLATQEVMEGSAKVAILLLAGSLAPLPTWMRQGALGLAFGAGLLALALFLTSRFLPGDPGASREEAGPARRWLRDFARRLEVLREGRRFLLAFSFLLAMKVAEAAGIFCVQRAFDVTLPLSALPAALGGVMLASLVPFAPASLGTYEAGAYFVYTRMGVAPGVAMAMGLVQHLAILGTLVGAGFLVLTLRLAGSAWPRSLPLRVLRSLAFWAHYLFFSAAVGVLALRRLLTARSRRSPHA